MTDKMQDEKTKTTNDLLEAVGKYVNAHGGSAVVSGPIGLILDEKYKFKLVISVTGKPPTKGFDNAG